MMTPTEEIFPPLQPAPPACSYSECTSGHRWAPRLAIAACPGCAAPILATEMVNCPVCNEPTARTVLRTEHMSRAMGLQATCKGEQSRGESSRLVAERAYWTETEAQGGPKSALERLEDQALIDELTHTITCDGHCGTGCQVGSEPPVVVCPDERTVLASGGETDHAE